ncbi:MAG: nucleoside triphosphate pyrophosphohydrolase [Bacteriovoracaceae bacterium]|jgi:MazG family protein|nr:nucleoside triphosphate pyrophosphohydrolase [Bacteriovoracaceae bacterium]
MQFENIHHVIEVIHQLRDPENGCPWDLKQTHHSLLKYLIEETYEYIQAVEQNDTKKMQEELGDVFLQILLHAEIASESGHFDLDSVSKTLAKKMIERHPHVFTQNDTNITSEEVSKNWEKIKSKQRGTPKYYIDIDDAYAPALLAAYNIGAKSRKIHFDWDELLDVWDKVEEELQEVKEEIQSSPYNKAKAEEEIGDLFFSIAQLARHLEIDPEQALKKANLKFIQRIKLVEDKVKLDKKAMQDLTTDQLEKYWQQVKKELKSY